jgi:hypothetical protein
MQVYKEEGYLYRMFKKIDTTNEATEIKTHVSMCPSVGVVCEFCKSLIVRRQMEVHLLVCELKPKICDYCETVYILQINHDKECLDMLKKKYESKKRECIILKEELSISKGTFILTIDEVKRFAYSVTKKKPLSKRHLKRLNKAKTLKTGQKLLEINYFPTPSSDYCEIIKLDEANILKHKYGNFSLIETRSFTSMLNFRTVTPRMCLLVKSNHDIIIAGDKLITAYSARCNYEDQCSLNLPYKISSIILINGNTIATGSYKGSINIYEFNMFFKSIKNIQIDFEILKLTAMGSGDQLLSISSDHCLRVWDYRKDSPCVRVINLPYEVLSVQMLKKGLITVYDSSLSLWDDNFKFTSKKAIQIDSRVKKFDTPSFKDSEDYIYLHHSSSLYIYIKVSIFDYCQEI